MKFGEFEISIREGPMREGDLAIANEQFFRDPYWLDDLRKVIEPTTILDIGGHIGCFALNAYKHWPQATIRSFEPNEESVKLYWKNSGGVCTVTRGAVDENPGHTTLMDNPGWAGGGVMVTPGPRPSFLPGHYKTTDKTVAVFSIEEAMEGLAQVGLLKLDCEGSEVGILRTLAKRPDLAERILFMVGEYHAIGWGNEACWEGKGFTAFAKLVNAAFPEWEVWPTDRPVEGIGCFAAGPTQLVHRLVEQRKHGAGPLPPVKTALGNWLSWSNVDGTKLTVYGHRPASYRVEFWDGDDLVYSTTLRPGQWSAPNPKWLVRWTVKVYEEADGSSSPPWQYAMSLNLNNRRVWVGFDSSSLGDTLAWIPYVDKLRRDHNAEVHVEVNSGLEKILASNYSELRFHEPRTFHQEVYAAYRVGAYDNGPDRNKRHWRTIPLQQIAKDALGMEDREEIRTNLSNSATLPPPTTRPYIAFSEHSTMKAKYWNYPGGWQAVVDWITSNGYEAVSVSKEPCRLKGVISCNGKSLEETMSNIQQAKAFIGLGAGPSWLAWGLGVPVVVISGFSEPWCEMQSGCYRVSTPDTAPALCHGCFNDPRYPFERGKWDWCPAGKGFECSASITPYMVIEKLKAALNLPEEENKVEQLPVTVLDVNTWRESEPTGLRVLFVSPHLSTGGLPAYLLEAVRELKAMGAAVEVIEWTKLSDTYVVQRNAMRATVDVWDRDKLPERLEKFKPNIVHFQEVPWAFMDVPAVSAVWRDNRRDWRIIMTSHNSQFNEEGMRRSAYKPEAFAAVGIHHGYMALAKRAEIVPYRFRYLPPAVRDARRTLGISQLGWHVLCVGLWCENKNQGEAIEVARSLPGVQFHFVGNQAPNFADYWKPLVEKPTPSGRTPTSGLPCNCRVWGEREDVTTFYEACDLLYLPSKSELKPLVVLEAQAVGIPVVMRRSAIPNTSDLCLDGIKLVKDGANFAREAIVEELLPMGHLLARLYESTLAEAVISPI